RGVDGRAGAHGRAFLGILVPGEVVGGRASVLAPGSALAPAFRAKVPVAAGGVRSPVTVAGPRRIHTGFLRFPSAMELCSGAGRATSTLGNGGPGRQG